MLSRAPRERRGILKQWPPVCPSGECNENKGCVCNKRKSSAAREYWETVKIIYTDCENIPATRPGDAPAAPEAAPGSPDSADSADSTDTLDLTCNETLDDVIDDVIDEAVRSPARKRVRWNVSPRPVWMKSGVQRRWESPNVVLCIEEELELSYHDQTQVWAAPVPRGCCYEGSG